MEVGVDLNTVVLEANGVFLLRLLVAMLLGGLVGMERQSRGRAAGLRTNILVCLGSAAIIVAFDKLSRELGVGAESAIRMDPARAAAGVITGIGFLGAGSIIKSKEMVRGLTTAASIWVVAAIGVTVGLGEYMIAVVLTLLVLLSLYVLHKLPLISDHYYTLGLKWKGDPSLLDEVYEELRSRGAVVLSREIARQPVTGLNRVTLGLRRRGKKQEFPLLDLLREDTRFEEVNWI